MASLLQGGGDAGQQQQQQRQQHQQRQVPAAERAATDAARSDALAEAIASAKRNEVEVARLKVEVMDLSARLYFAEDQLAAYKQRFGDL